jgi:acyl-CoA synthetase (AMP-forming)/AMP-acid ligase II
VVVLKPDQTVPESELIGFARPNWEATNVPKSVEFWESIPTTPIGKILRKDVKKKFWEGHERSIG